MARFAAIFALCALAATALTVSACRFPLNVTGRVYLDTCNMGFETTESLYTHGSSVQLECKHRKTGKTVHNDTAVTDEEGNYSFTVMEDQGNARCQVSLVNCTHINAAGATLGRDSSLVSLTCNNGMATSQRLANNLGVNVKTTLQNCDQIVAQYHLDDDNF
ncbi:unnamed protein product [Cuscuta europaea]|uniref:Uncharacterized protein n=1 Tax=Cuscuta europaea TaxID=41803 RepID=A0A9P0ZP25_CUSEU|nr:unnamed protein product [Cuscuta europaea]